MSENCCPPYARGSGSIYNCNCSCCNCCPPEKCDGTITWYYTFTGVGVTPIDSSDLPTNCCADPITDAPCPTEWNFYMPPLEPCKATITLYGSNTSGCGFELTDGKVYSIGRQTVTILVPADDCDAIAHTIINGITIGVDIISGGFIEVADGTEITVDLILEPGYAICTKDGPHCVAQMMMLQRRGNKSFFEVHPTIAQKLKRRMIGIRAVRQIKPLQ